MFTIRRLVVAAAVTIPFICGRSVAIADELTAAVRPARGYEVHELTLGGSECKVATIHQGVAVGSGNTPGNVATHAFVWTRRTGIVDIGSLGGSSAGASAVDGDRVVGTSLTTGDTEMHAFVWTPTGGMQDLGTLGGSFSGAGSISGNRVVGESTTALGDIHAFVWTAATGMMDLGTLPGGTESSPAQVHRGLIAGWSAVSGSAIRTRRPVAWLADGQIIDIVGEPFDIDSEGWVRGFGQSTDVRNGLVVGYRHATAALENHAFIWNESQGAVDLGVIPGYNESFAFGTDGRYVVGQLSGGILQRPFVWSASEGMIALGPRSVQGWASHVRAGRVVGVFLSPQLNGARSFLWTAAQGMVDVTPRSFPNGARPVGIDAEGLIAVSDDAGDIMMTRSAVLVPRRGAQ